VSRRRPSAGTPARVPRSRPARDGEKPPARREVLLDLLAILGAWLALAFALGRGSLVTAYDVFRDMSYAQAILDGHLWQDPSILGLRAWYPPGNPLGIAGLSALTRIPPVELYATSLYWLGWINPVVLYLLVRSRWGRATALVSLAVVPLGSFWWFTHAAMPMASVQGVSLGLLALLAWTTARDRGFRRAAVTGVLLALAIWHHPICGALALGSILLQGGVAALLPAERSAPVASRFELASKAALAVAVGLLLAAPLLLRQLGLPRTNAAPHHWFAPELHDPRFALHLHAPLIVPLGLVGLWLAARRWRDEGWLVAYFAIGLAGQLAGYLGHDAAWRIPWVLPHEFQWHEQLALMIAAASATVWLATRFAAGVRGARRGTARRAGIAALLALSVAPALFSLPVADSYLMRLDERWRASLATARWVRANTPHEAVFACPPETGFFLSGLTGCKVVALPPGHMNPAADVDTRLSDLSEMLTTRDEQDFLRLAARYRVTHLLVTPRTSGARAVYSRWGSLEPVDLADSTVLVYRIRRAAGP
jgi:hypothetical protein